MWKAFSYESMFPFYYVIIFFFNDTATTEIYTLSLHDALPISQASPGIPRTEARRGGRTARALPRRPVERGVVLRSEEHTSELQSQSNLVCRLLLEKKTNDDTRAPTGKTMGH